jgi:hypothetical protein
MHEPDRRPTWQQLGDESGVTLVEVMVAIFLLATAMMAMSQVATSGLLSLRDATDRTAAISLATQSLEASRQLPWESLQLEATAHAARCGQMITIADDGSVTEPAVCHATDAVGDVAPFWGDIDGFEIETYVTAIADFPNARRVTAVVEWGQGSQIRTVRSSTVIAQVSRG